MADESQRRDLDALLSRGADRGFGDIPLRAGGALRPYSEGWMAAAANLLDKALDALDRGDDDRAGRFITRAVDLPYDDYEDAPPAEWQAEMALFMAVTDACDDDVDADEAWLDAALDALAVAPFHGRCTLRDCLVTMTTDYEMPPAMVRRIRSHVAAVPTRQELRLLSTASREDRVQAIRETLEALLAFEDALLTHPRR